MWFGRIRCGRCRCGCWACIGRRQAARRGPLRRRTRDLYNLRLCLCVAVVLQVPVITGLGWLLLAFLVVAALVHLHIPHGFLQVCGGRVLKVIELELVLQRRRWRLPVKAAVWWEALLPLVPVVPWPQGRLIWPGGGKWRRPGRTCPPPTFAKPELHCCGIRDLACPLLSGRERCHPGVICHKLVEAYVQWEVQVHLAEEEVQVLGLAEVACWHTQQDAPIVVCSSCVGPGREVVHGNHGHVQGAHVGVGEV